MSLHVSVYLKYLSKICSWELNIGFSMLQPILKRLAINLSHKHLSILTDAIP